MKYGTILGIYREQVFSPGKIYDDEAILARTLEALAVMGYEVEGLHAEDIDGNTPETGLVLSMAQSARAMGILDEWCGRGTQIINTVQSVRNCYRRPLVHLLQGSGVCMPRSRMVTLERARVEIDLKSSKRLWLKRGDVHAIQEGDVASVSSREELDLALDHYRSKGIHDILVQEHVEGPVVKFYSVGQHEYFKAYLAETGEDISERVPGLPPVARLAAKAVGLEVYGGDAVLTDGNGASLIDLNDWPSFSRCCDSAAKSIAGYVAGRIQLQSGDFCSSPAGPRLSSGTA
jgi:glutathione synthase/RimK-type ligase-like ATP-grasp enzyme